MHERLVAALLAVSLCPVCAVAQSSDPFLLVLDRDPMELARVVAREGDEMVLERLMDERRDVRLAAIIASPWMTGPELALPVLARIAAGRDPRLSTAAAASALQIVRRIDSASIARRECSPTELQGARSTFASLAADQTARPDLRAAARVTVAQLALLGVPEANPQGE